MKKRGRASCKPRRSRPPVEWRSPSSLHKVTDLLNRRAARRRELTVRQVLRPTGWVGAIPFTLYPPARSLAFPTKGRRAATSEGSPMPHHNAAAGRYITSAPVTSTQMWLIVAWILAGSELGLQLSRAAGPDATATTHAWQLGFYGVLVLWVLWLRRGNGLNVPRLFGPPPTQLSRIYPVVAGPSLALVWMGLWTLMLHAGVAQAGPTSPPPALEDFLDWRHPASALR